MGEMERKMFYREHRGGFQGSLETMREIKGISELGDVEVKPYGYDARLQSDTQIVLKDGYPCGFITFGN